MVFLLSAIRQFILTSCHGDTTIPMVAMNIMPSEIPLPSFSHIEDRALKTIAKKTSITATQNLPSALEIL